MALSTLELTLSGDIKMNTLSQAVTLIGRDAIEQKITAAFSLWRGNWFRNPLRGVDWLNVFKKKFTRREVIQILTTAILQLNAVISVIDIYLKVDKPTRKAEITYVVKTDSGIVEGSVVL